jgi:hypothetical protein
MSMKTKTKMWLGVGAFAIASAAGVSMNGAQPSLTIGQPAQAADGTCGWERSEGRWIYDQDCGRGERFTGNRYNYQNNERGERWGRHDNGWHRGWDRGERGRYNEQGERWGERGERWGG